MSQEQKKTGNIVGTVILLTLFLVLGIFIGRNINQNDAARLLSFGEKSSKSVDMNMFWQVWDLASREYVDSEKLNTQEMIYGAIKGMINSIDDAATVFLDPEETKEFTSASEGKYFEGIGAELGYEKGIIVIISPIEGSPAKEAGLRPGDYILKIDGYELTVNDTVYDAVAKIRGKSGTEVVLTVLHKDEKVPVEIKITRREITVPSMGVEFIGEKKDIARFTVARFTDVSLASWEKEWDKNVQQIKDSKVNKVILDLRGNPGGFFDAAIYAGGDFLDKGFLISQQRDSRGRVNRYESTKLGNLLSEKIVVLVDGGSASASEILAGAIQQAKRGVIIGEKTYGKGTAQRIFDLSDGSSLHLTTLKWLLPDGKSLDREHSITPDIEVKLTNEDFKNGSDPQLERAIQEISK